MYSFGLNFSYCNPFMNFFMPFGGFTPLTRQPLFGDFSLFGGYRNNYFPFGGFLPFGKYIPDYNYSFGKNYTNPGCNKPVSVFNKTPFVNSNTKLQTQSNQKSFNSAKANMLIKNINEIIPTVEPNPPMCAKYVREAIINSGLGKYVSCNGETSKYMLRNNQNFKEIKVKKNEMSKLPNGSIITYDAGTPVTYADGSTGKVGENGHVTIKTGATTAISDRKEDLPMSDRAYVFIPV